MFPSTTHLVKDSTNEDDVYTATMYHLQEGNKVKAFEVDHIKWKLTLAQPRTVISEETYNKLSDKLGLRSTTAVLSTYTGEKIPVVGMVMVPVKYENQPHDLSSMVVKSPGPNLLGREDWLQVNKFDWNTVFSKVQDCNPS